MRFLVLVAALWAFPLRAEVVPPPGIDIYVLGEVHDNPAHHAEQARLVGLIAPGAVVWEMLSEAQVQAIAGMDKGDAAALAAALGWENSGWPDFAFYHPILLASGQAVHLGAAAPRAEVRAVMAEGLASVIGAAAVAEWGLGPLPDAEQAPREAEQAAAHCDALPVEMLPSMVEAQRLRDWYLASRAIAAIGAGQAPVVVITGSGHARKDRGVPALIAAARPELKVWSLGQIELAEGEGAEPGQPFDAVNATPAHPARRPLRGLLRRLRSAHSGHFRAMKAWQDGARKGAREPWR